jgi:hypothetical protein
VRRRTSGLIVRERYREWIAWLADQHCDLDGCPWPALLARIDAGETIRSIQGYELDLADIHGLYDLAADGTVTPSAMQAPMLAARKPISPRILRLPSRSLQ